MRLGGIELCILSCQVKKKKMLGRPFVHFAGLWEKKEGKGKERILNYA